MEQRGNCRRELQSEGETRRATRHADSPIKLRLQIVHPRRHGQVSVGGNLYSVPDTTRRRVLDVHVFADAIRIFEDGKLIAAHAPLEGRGEKRLDPPHRKMLTPASRRRSPDAPLPLVLRAGDHAARRPLAFYDAVGRRLAMQGGAR